MSITESNLLPPLSNENTTNEAVMTPIFCSSEAGYYRALFVAG